jgi:hypothetical protein
VPDAGGVEISVDAFEPKSGARSLHLQWAGNSNPGTPVISQTVLVESRASYRLRFVAREKDIVTGGLPLVVITDASSKDAKVLAKSRPLPQQTGGWQEYEVEFETGETTEAVTISLQRENCTGSPCPIFGITWLDDFSLQRK